MWFEIQKKNPVWFIDATGGIIKDLKGQKKPFYYSVICHDLEKKNVISISDFVSTDNRSSNISVFFNSIKVTSRSKSAKSLSFFKK